MNKSLEEAFADGKHLFLLYGEEKFLLNQSIEKIKKHFLNPDAADLNLDVIDSIPKDSLDIINKCNTMPFMAEYRLVILNNIGIFDSKNKSILDKLTEELDKIPNSTILIMKDEGIDKRKKAYKFFEKHGYIKEYAYLNEEEIIKYLGKWFYQFGLRIRNNTIHLLIQRAGNDLTTLIREAEKLSNYATDIVTDEMVIELVKEQLESKIFALTDALGAKNRKEAILQYRIMIENRESVNNILYMIGRHMKLLYQARILSRNRVSSFEMSKTLAVHKFVAEKLNSQSKLFTEQEIGNILKNLLQLEWDYKRGKVDLETGLEMFLISTSMSAGR